MQHAPFSLILLQAEALTRPDYLFTALVVLCGFILVLLFGLLIILMGKNRRAHRKKQVQHHFQDWLVGILLTESAAEGQVFEVPAKVQALLQQSDARQQLLEELTRLKNTVSGQPGANLERLYHQLALARIPAASLRSRQWNRITRGIQQLAVMNHRAFAGQIAPFANHRHPVVRMEAQIALVFLQGYRGLSFLENLRYPLTEWHQVRLLHLLASQAIPAAQPITHWLQSPNVSVVQFTLKLIGQQHAVTFQDQVMACLHHPQELIRRQAVVCLGEMPTAAAAQALRRQYRQETSASLQSDIVAVLSKAGLPLLQPQAPDIPQGRKKAGAGTKAWQPFKKMSRRKKLIKAQ